MPEAHQGADWRASGVHARALEWSKRRGSWGHMESLHVVHCPHSHLPHRIMARVFHHIYIWTSTFQLGFFPGPMESFV